MASSILRELMRLMYANIAALKETQPHEPRVAQVPVIVRKTAMASVTRASIC
jgi:hypothetical protein